MVADSQLLVVGVEDALIRAGPLAVHRLNRLGSVQRDHLPEHVEVIDRFLNGHVGREDLLPAAGHLQVAVPIVGVQEVEVTLVLRRLDQSLDREVGLGDVEAAHFSVPYCVGWLRLGWMGQADAN